MALHEEERKKQQSLAAVETPEEAAIEIPEEAAEVNSLEQRLAV